MEYKDQSISSNPPRVLLIGLGPFAKRAYVPHLESLEAHGRAKLMAVVDIEANEHALRKYQQAVLKTVELIFVPYFTSEMPRSVKLTLTDLVARLQISCVIISTEPLAHCAYGLWALDMGLNIVMDKPVTTRPSAVSSLEESHGIAKDFDKLPERYSALQHRQNTCFLINSHRRYHVGFHRTAEIIKQVQEKTGCPVTSISSMHCDGQWRLPSEIILQDYHTYNRGYGKVSHSGYHTIDSVYQLLKAGMGKTKRPDRVEVISSFVQPRGFLFQLNEQDYQRLFGAKTYTSAAKFSENELHEYTRDFGEMDATVQLTFYHAGEAIALVNLDLQHNGFGRRTWLQPGQDLYKGNGRVRHEMHEIKSGPFQTIVVNSRQSSDRHDTFREDHAELGGNGHFDIEIFQNCEMLGHRKPLQIIKLDDLISPQPLESQYSSYSRSVKHAALDELIEFMERKKPMHDLKSNLPDHSIPAHIMSAIYVSHVRRKSGFNPIVSLDLSFTECSGTAQLSSPRI